MVSAARRLPPCCFCFNQSILDAQGRVLPTWADVLNRANLDLAAAETIPVLLQAPAIG